VQIYANHLRSLRSRGNDLIADIRDPAGGFVSLRSVIVSTAGTRSTETIYRAHAVS
jgi:hypothetical protein